jgi:CHAT domain-containing protein/tetratricopeptide (TPR) repeat protein
MPARRIATLSRSLLCSFLVLALSPRAKPATPQKSSSRGAVVEEVEKGKAGEKAGIQPGDMIVSWSRTATPPANPIAARGRLESPFDLLEVEFEQGPRGRITLSGKHGKKKSNWVLPTGPWGLKTRPPLLENLFALYQQGKELVEAKKVKEGVARWRDAAEDARKRESEWLAAWLFFKLGATLAGARNWSEADAAYTEAIEEAEKGGRTTTISYLLRDWGQTFLRRSNLDRMEECYRRAMAQDQKLAPESMTVAHSLTNLGIAAANRGKFAEAEGFFQRALTMREKLAPDSVDVGRSLSNLGTLALSRDELSTAEEYLRRALRIFEKLVPESPEIVTLLNNLGGQTARAGKLDAGEDYFVRALAIQEKLAPGSLQVAMSLNNLGVIAGMRGKREAQEEYYRRALEIDEKQAPESPGMADILSNLGDLAYERGDLAAAEQYTRRALAIRERLAPGTREVAQLLNNVGTISLKQGKLDSAEENIRRSLAIGEKLEPGSPQVASNLDNLGVVAWQRGDLAGAGEYHQRALAMHEKLDREGSDVAGSLNNLGLVARDRGDLAAAEEYFRRAHAIFERLAPGSQHVANALTNLGNLASARGDPATAKEYELQALAIHEKQAPNGIEVARSLNNLGREALDLGDATAAQDYQLRALTIREKLAPDSLDVASTLGNLGNLASQRGDPTAASEFYRRSLAIRERLAPDSLTVAYALNDLGGVLLDLGDQEKAEQNYRRALAIREKLALGSAAEAESLHALGSSYRKSRKASLAISFFCRAVDALEHQKTKLGGTEEAKTSFGTKYADYYRDCIEALTEQDRAEEALRMLERSRARSLLNMLAERDLLFSADLPADLARDRKLTDADYDRTQSAVTKLNPAKDSEEIERQLAHLRELRRKQEDIALQIRKASPHFASLQYPQPLDVAGVREALDPGTVLLAYSVGKEKTILFVVRQDRQNATTVVSGLTVLTLPLTERSLRERVEAFRNVIQRHKASDLPILSKQAGELYDSLIAPAEQLIASSERILISPDGPLHTVPFAALVRKERTGKKREVARYLIEWKPIHTVVSATVYAELKKSRHAGLPSSLVRVVAFGDPRYPTLDKDKAGQIRDGELRAMVTRGLSLAPLPSTRAEVESIARLYPEDTAKYLGAEATEERAKSISKDVRYIHFAVHGLLDEHFPLNSALALSIPEKPDAGQDNGLLQAWEIFENMRIDADLVTLSACETALGKEMGGEGLVGLTRAFQYAGARSVLASLWSVSDESTAELMKRFYGYLKAGRTKDEALRASQIDLIRGGASAGPNAKDPAPSASHPFHWAAFQLIGDWK